MEIERINENTIKFYISYLDIEDRGFEREEIWYNRERSEQLFWQMMEEVNYKEDFSVEGPLWIQVQALEKGLEVIVTKSQISKQDEPFGNSLQSDSQIDLPVDERIENILERKFGKRKEMLDERSAEEEGSDLTILLRFNDFEDVIQLSHYFPELDDYIFDVLYVYENKYYLHVDFPHRYFNEQEQDNYVSQLLEYGEEDHTSIHLLEEYGRKLFKEKALVQIKALFKN